MRRGGVGAAFPAGFCRILLEMWILGFSPRALVHDSRSLRILRGGQNVMFSSGAARSLVPWWRVDPPRGRELPESRVFAMVHSDHAGSPMRAEARNSLARSAP